MAGVDEAGRGPLAGPVCAAAVILGNLSVNGIADSKTLCAGTRQRLARTIRAHALAWSIGWADIDEILQHNILGATMLAMRRAVAGLPITPALLLVDGNRNPHCPLPTRLIVKGDAHTTAIAAASIVAKVARDRYMRFAHLRYPQYLFDRNKGYASAAHLRALQIYGCAPIHRRRFAPVAATLAAQFTSTTG